MKTILKLAAALLLCITFLISGCSNDNLLTPIEKEDTQNMPHITDELRIGVCSHVKLDPFQIKNDEERLISNLVYNGLVIIDGKGHTKPCLAESWDISDDGKIYTFHLKKGVKWHDGQDLTSQDVIATFDRLFLLKETRYKEDKATVFPELDYILDYSAPDESTVVVTLNQPFGGILGRMTFGIAPASYLKSQSNEENAELVPGTGQFKVTNSTTDTITLERNESYFGTKPIIAKVNVRMFGEKASAKQSFRKGEIDLLFINNQDWNFFRDVKGMNLIQYPSSYLEFVALNQRNPIFEDASVRKALLAGIDRPAILQNAVQGLGIIVDGPVLPHSWVFNSAVQSSMYNMDMAAQILKDAGWEDIDGDGIKEKRIKGKTHKFEFELLVNSSNSSRYQAAVDIQENLKEIGISVRLVNLSWDELKKRVLDKQYDAALMGWKLLTVPDLNSMFSSKAIKNGYNFVSYSEDELDAILDKANVEKDEEKFQELMYEAQEIIARDVPYLFLYSPNSIVCVSERIKGVAPDTSNVFDSISKWYVE